MSLSVEELGRQAAQLEKQAILGQAVMRFAKTQAPKLLGQSAVKSAPKTLKPLAQTAAKPLAQTAAKPVMSTTSQMASAVRRNPRTGWAARGDDLPGWLRQNLKREHGVRSYNQLREALPMMQTKHFP